MTLEKYMDILTMEIKNNPALLECKVVYSSDDEGNVFNEVKFTPTPGNFNKENEFDSESKDINAICIN